MVSKGIYMTAIKKLEDANQRLFIKASKSENEAEKEKLRSQMSANNALILDYKFRMEHDD